MKKSVLILLLTIFSFTFVSASCNLGVTMLNQDPYPAVPGDYVKLVFQVTGTQSSDCGYISFELLEKYPISFDPDESAVKQIKGGGYEKDYSTSLLVPYKVRVDKNALEGNNTIEVRYGTGKSVIETYESKLFDLEVDDTHADFEVYINDYDATTKTLTLEILNIADSDIEALTLEIPEQSNIKILGAKTNILGDLDSNEYTTADFKAQPQAGEIKVKISYNDAINVRRTTEKTITFNPEYFQSTESSGKPWYIYLIYLIIIGSLFYYFYNRRKKKKEHARHKRGSAKLS